MRLSARWSFSVDKLTRHPRQQAQLIKADISEHVPAHTHVHRYECMLPTSHLTHTSGDPAHSLAKLTRFLGKQSPASSCKIHVQLTEGPGRAVFYRAVPLKPCLHHHGDQAQTCRQGCVHSIGVAREACQQEFPIPLHGRQDAGIDPRTEHLTTLQSYSSQQEPGAARE